MKTSTFLLHVAFAAGAVTAATGTLAQTKTWPERTVRIVVPSAAGGAADFMTRTFANFVKQQLPQATVVAENRPGAGGIVGTDAAAKSAPDGYTFLLSTNSTHAANSSLYKKLPYDPVKDFDAVGLFGTFATIAMVPQSSPFKTISELVDYAKKNPGKLNFGYYSSSSRVPPELVKARTGIDVVGAPYKNITQIVTDMLGGQIQFAFLDSLSAAPALQNNRLVPIATSATQRSRTLPNVATVAETLPGYEVQGWLGLTAPAGTPKEVIERVNMLMGQAVADASVREALERQGMTPRAMSPAELTAYIAADRVRWADWIRTANIQPE